MTKKRRAFSQRTKEYRDSDFKHKLSAEEREWYLQFEDEYYQNNHREDEDNPRELIHEKHPEYETKLKKNLDDANNCRNRDVHLLNRYDKKLIRDLVAATSAGYYNSQLEKVLSKKGLKKTVNDLLTDALLDIGVTELQLEHGREVLSNMCIDVLRCLKLEQAAERSAGRKGD